MTNRQIQLISFFWLIVISLVVFHLWIFSDSAWLHIELLTAPDYIWAPPRNEHLIWQLQTLFDWSIFDSSPFRLRLASDALELLDALTRPKLIWLFGMHPSLTLSSLFLAIMSSLPNNIFNFSSIF